jgi:hypothetical protein
LADHCERLLATLDRASADAVDRASADAVDRASAEAVHAE